VPIVLIPRLDFTTISTPIGPLTFVAVDGVVHAAGFTRDVGQLADRLAPVVRGLPIEATSDLGPITAALEAYFAGDAAALDGIPVSLRGGPFQLRVWAALRAIPPGQPTTYRDLARQMGGASLARAVGMANAANPIAPIVPCHRLVGSDGRLTGYYWGLDRKRWLLDHERRHAQGR
jgi:methylated-DNA-[protein]-cysteine S-methyltransferase